MTGFRDRLPRLPATWPAVPAWALPAAAAAVVLAWLLRALTTLDSRAARRHDQLVSQLAADRDLADQHREATHEIADSVTALHHRLDPIARPSDPGAAP